MYRIVITAIMLLLATTPLTAGPSSSSSSRSSYSSSSGSYSKPSTSYKPSTPPSPKTAMPPSSNGYSKPAVKPEPRVVYPNPPASLPAIPSIATGAAVGAAVGAATQPAQAKPDNTGYSKPGTSSSVSTEQKHTGALSEAASRSMSSDALTRYKAERAEIKAPAKPVNTDQIRKDPVFTETRKQYSSVDDYMNQRSQRLNDYYTRYPESRNYTRDMSPNYGMFDNNFLMGMLLGQMGSNNTNAAWMNSQRDQEWYRQWRSDVDKKSNENAELKAKLNAMDAEMARIKQQPQQPKPAVLPEGISSSIAIAPEAIVAAEPIKSVEKLQDNKSSWIWWILGITLVGCVVLLTVLNSIGARDRRSLPR